MKNGKVISRKTIIAHESASLYLSDRVIHLVDEKILKEMNWLNAKPKKNQYLRKQTFPVHALGSDKKYRFLFSSHSVLSPESTT